MSGLTRIESLHVCLMLKDTGTLYAGRLGGTNVILDIIWHLLENIPGACQQSIDGKSGSNSK
jgi:hypothetical protein